MYTGMHFETGTMTIQNSLDVLKAEQKAMSEIKKILETLDRNNSKKRVLKYLFDILNSNQ
jgi:hypothetical protein